MAHEARRRAVSPRRECGCGGWLTPTWGVIDSLWSDSASGWPIPSGLRSGWRPYKTQKVAENPTRIDSFIFISYKKNVWNARKKTNKLQYEKQLI